MFDFDIWLMTRIAAEVVYIGMIFVIAGFRPQVIKDWWLFRWAIGLLGLSLIWYPIAVIIVSMWYVVAMGFDAPSVVNYRFQRNSFVDIILAFGPSLLGVSIALALFSLVPKGKEAK